MRITLFSIKDYNIKIKMSTYLEIQMQSFNVLFFRNNLTKYVNVTFLVLYNKNVYNTGIVLSIYFNFHLN